MEPSLSVLVCALVDRRPMRKALLERLVPQMAEHGAELIVVEDDGRMPSGAKRNALLASARGAYVAFVDDDDTVTDDYVASLVEAAGDGPDVVSFDLMRHLPGRTERQSLGLHLADRQRLPNGRVGMTANHLCAWRRGLARSVGFMPHLGYNDDVFWYTPLVASGLAATEHHVDKVLYHYHWWPEQTLNQRPEIVEATRRWAKGGVPVYRRRAIAEDGCRFVEILVGAAGRGAPQTGEAKRWTPKGESNLLHVVDRHGAERYLPAEELRLFCTVEAK